MLRIMLAHTLSFACLIAVRLRDCLNRLIRYLGETSCRLID